MHILFYSGICGGIGLQVFKVQGLKPLHGKIKVQGAKNAVLPMMAVSLLTEGRTEIRNVPRISDVFLMAEILRDLGCQVMFQDDVLEIDASGLSGTVISEKTVGKMRSSSLLLGPLLSRAGEVTTWYPGGCEIGKRPIDFHLDVLRAMGAAVLKAEETGIIDMMMGADGTKGDVLACTSRTVGNFLTGTKPELGFMTMDGQEVFKFAVRKVPESVMELLQRTGTKKEDIKYYVLHQANERIIEAAARRLKEPMEKFPMTIGQFGNTSTASIPLLLDDMIQKDMLKRGDKIIMSGFGAGMTWGAVLMEW